MKFERIVVYMKKLPAEKRERTDCHKPVTEAQTALIRTLRLPYIHHAK